TRPGPLDRAAGGSTPDGGKPVAWSTLLNSWLRRVNRRLSGGKAGRCRARGSPRRRCVPRCEVLEGRALPSTFTVLNLADSGSGSLRAAVLAAEAHPGPDVIDFAHNLYGTITLTSGQLNI